MGKWFEQAAEIQRLREQVQRQRFVIDQLRTQLGGDQVDIYGVSDEERRLVAAGKPIEAIKDYRQRTGADLLTAKTAIDSVTE